MRQQVNFSAYVIAASVLAIEASAFWGKGHLMVSRIAQRVLEDKSPHTLEQALTELSTLAHSHPEMVEHEKDHPFTECATFADIIKDTFGNWQTPWHFIDQPYLDEPGTSLDDFDFAPADVDVVSALTDFKAFLEDSKDMSDSKYIRRVAQQFPDPKDQRSFVLRMVVHYVGDIHQPLHGTAEVDHRYPEGDMGGNLHKLPADPDTGVEDLHAVWDSVIYEFPGYETLPFDAEIWQWYSDQSEGLEDRHPIDQTKEKVTSFGQWATESLNLSEQLVYPGFVENEKPSQEYIDMARPALEARVVLAGYRLADLVISIYESKSLQQASETTLFL